MILVDEAVARYADALGAFGARPKRNRQPRHIASLLDEIDGSLPGDLRIPGDLRDFWTDWNPSTFGLALGDGFPTVERSLAEWEASELPSILLLVCSTQERGLYLEMQSTTHPGTRLYMAQSGQQVLSLWGIGIVALLDLVSQTYQETAADPEGPYHEWVDTTTLGLLAEQAGGRIVSTAGERSVDLEAPGTWPKHWQLAEGRPSPSR